MIHRGGAEIAENIIPFDSARCWCLASNVLLCLCGAAFTDPRGEKLTLISMVLQVFGTKKSAETRAALRFFAERRLKVHFVDLNERPAALNELRRCANKVGVASLSDRSSRRFAELGLGAARLSDDRWLEKLSEEPLLLQLPLVRRDNQVTIGPASSTWREWLDA